MMWIRGRLSAGFAEFSLVPHETIEVQESGYLLTRPNGSQNLLLHHELCSVEVLNRGEVFFLLNGSNTSIVVSHDAQGAGPLLAHLQKLPGFDSAAVVQAMADEGQHLCWKKS